MSKRVVSVVMTVLCVYAIGSSTFAAHSQTVVPKPNTPVKDQLKPNPVNQKLTLSQRLQKNLKFRREFGLNTNLGFVKQTIENNSSVTYMGVKMTQSEKEELKARLAFQNKAVPIIRDFFKKHASEDIFAGLYADQSKGVLRVGLNEEPSKLKKVINKVKSLVGQSKLIDFYYAKYTKSQLENKHKEVVNYLRENEIPFKAVKTNFSKQRIDIYGSYTDETIKKIYSTVGRKMVKVRITKVQKIGNSARDTTTRPLEGGLQIYHDADNKPGYITICTGAFFAYDAHPQPTQEQGFFYITAGHCGDGYRDFWSQGSLYYGTAIARRHDSGSSDGYAEYISLSTNVSPDLYEYSSRDRQFTSVQGMNGDYQGEAVCKSGERTGVTCGTIVTTNGTYFFNEGGYFYNMRESTNYNNHGDSGAPVYGQRGSNGAQVFGVLKGYIEYTYQDGSKDRNTIYSQVQYVLNDLGLDTVILAN